MSISSGRRRAATAACVRARNGDVHADDARELAASERSGAASRGDAAAAAACGRAARPQESVTLDIDATAAHCEKSSSEFTYKKEKGYMPIVGHVAETGMAAGAEFRGGSAARRTRATSSPSASASGRLPKGVAVRRARIDAAGCQAKIISHFASRGVGCAIRAKLDARHAQGIRGGGAAA